MPCASKFGTGCKMPANTVAEVLHDEVRLRQRLILRIRHVDVGRAPLIDDLPHFGTLSLGQRDDRSEIARVSGSCCTGEDGTRFALPNRVFGVRDNQALELVLQLRDRCSAENTCD